MASRPRYFGRPEVINGNGAVARVMNMVCGGVIGYPITPSTEISETFEAALAQGARNVWGKHPFFFEPEGEHSAQSGAMGAALTGGKFISNASSSQGVLYALESHYVTVGKRIGGFVLHVAARAVSRHSLNVMGGHDDVYSLLPAGYTILFGANPEEAADLALISYRTSALSLLPVANCMDGFSTSHMMSEARIPEPELVRDYLGDPAGYIPCPTVAQEVLFGAKGRAFQFAHYCHSHKSELLSTTSIMRTTEFSDGITLAGPVSPADSNNAENQSIAAPPPTDPLTAICTFLDVHAAEIEDDSEGQLFDEHIAPLLPPDKVRAWRRQWVNAPAKGTRQLVPALVDIHNPGLTGPVQNQPDFQAGVADNRAHFQADVPRLVRQAMREYNELTGRDYAPVKSYFTDDADYILVCLGSISEDVLAVLPYLRERGMKAGLVQIQLLQPFPEAEFVQAVRGAKSVTVLERSDHTALTSFVNTALLKAAQNVRAERYVGIPALAADELPTVSTGFFGLGGHDVQPRHLIATVKAMAADDLAPEFYLGSTFFDPQASGEQAELQKRLRAAYPQTEKMQLHLEPNPPGLLPEEAMRIRFHSVGGYGTIATGKLITDILAELLHLHSKAAPKYGSEKSGAPTNYYITLSPEPIKITNAELEDVEIVISPDHMAFAHTNPLKGLVEGGTFIIQSNQAPRDFWDSLPAVAQQIIRERHIKLYTLDAFEVAKHYAPDESLEIRMMGVAFIGAVVTTVDRIASGSNIGAMLERVHRQLEKKFGMKGSSIVEANMAVVEEGAKQAVRVDYESFVGGVDCGGGDGSASYAGDGDAGCVRDTAVYSICSAASGKEVSGNAREEADFSADMDRVEAAAGAPNTAGSSVHPVLPVRDVKLSARMAGVRGCSLMNGLFNEDYFARTMGDYFTQGMISEAPAMPGSGFFLPPASAAAKDKGLFRRQVPVFDASLCTGCMECALVCPDAAIPNTVFSIETLLTTAVREAGHDAQPLSVHIPAIAESMREILLAQKGKNRPSIADVFVGAVENFAVNNGESALPEAASTLTSYEQPSGVLFQQSHLGESAVHLAVTDVSVTAVAAILRSYPAARTRSFFDAAEKKNPGSGMLFSATIDPWKCTGCLECVSVCPPNALVPTQQNQSVIDQAQERFAFAAALPNTPSEISDPQSGANVDMKRIFLDRRNYYSTIGGHGACRGCGEVTAIRQTMALANEINRRRVENHRAELHDLVDGVAARIARIGVSEQPSISDMRSNAGNESAASQLGTVDGVDAGMGSADMHNAHLEPEGLRELLAQLERRLYRYEGSASGSDPAATVIANSTGCSSVYASTAPFNSYKDPWVNGLFQDAQPLAKGIFEGLAADLSADILAIRQARALLEGTPWAELPQDPPEWLNFTSEELALMPAVMTVGGDGASYDIGFGALSRILTSQTPIKILVLNTGAYSNTGGQSSTASLEGQDADLSRVGTFHHGKIEPRKELGLLAAMHPDVLVVCTSASYQAHFLKNVGAALAQNDFPAVIDVYTPCQPEHGIGDDEAAEHAKMAVKARISPLFVHEPQHENFADRFIIAGNPNPTDTWSKNRLNYIDDDGAAKTLNLPYTPADFAASENRFRKHFSALSEEDPKPTPAADYVELPVQERAGRTPFIYTVDSQGKLARKKISSQLVSLTEQCRDYWHFLQYLAGQDLDKLRKENQDLTAKIAHLSAESADVSMKETAVSATEIIKEHE